MKCLNGLYNIKTCIPITIFDINLFLTLILFKMNEKQIDVPVLLIFFNRPFQTKLVFEQIRKARPSKLYLYQDGPRIGNKDDFINIQKCREIVENIDWKCETHKFYQEDNFGCDPSEFISQKWMFKHEEYGIVLEDDDIPSQSFFPFCKELLEKYKHDERINIICGMNHLGEHDDTEDSYLFTTSGSIWGWASWKRVIEKWDENYKFLDNKKAMDLLMRKIGKREYNKFIKTCKKHKKSGKAHYETILVSSMYLNASLNIVPSKNLISNIGIAENSTHSVSSIKKLPKGIRRVFFMKTNEFQFPLKHPEYIIEDVNYKSKVEKIMGYGYLVSKFRFMESVIYRTLNGDFKNIIKSIKNRLIEKDY
jgi:hypothetical protein